MTTTHKGPTALNEDEARTLAENLMATAAVNARSMAALYRKPPPQQEGLSQHFAFALRSATGHITSRLEEHTDQVAQTLMDPATGHEPIIHQLDIADWDSTNCRKYVATAVEDARHTVALKGRGEAHAQAIAEAMFHHIQAKADNAALKNPGWEHPASWLRDARNNMVTALSTEHAGYTHILNALEVIETVNRACSN